MVKPRSKQLSKRCQCQSDIITVRKAKFTSASANFIFTSIYEILCTIHSILRVEVLNTYIITIS